MVFALDTNIIIRYLRNESNVIQNFRNAVVGNHDIVIPQAVDYEICWGFRPTMKYSRPNTATHHHAKGLFNLFLNKPITKLRGHESHNKSIAKIPPYEKAGRA